MSKIKISSLLENKTEKEQHKIKTTGIKKDNVLQYQDQETHMILTIEQDKIVMKRVQKDAILKLTFHKSLTTEGIYDIKSVNMVFSIKICTKKLSIQEHQIAINYEMVLENEPPQEFYYQLNYEVIS